MSSPAQEDVFLFIFLIFFFLFISSLLLWNQELIAYEIHVNDVEEIV